MTNDVTPTLSVVDSQPATGAGGNRQPKGGRGYSPLCRCHIAVFSSLLRLSPSSSRDRFFREQKTITRQWALRSQSGRHRNANDADLKAWRGIGVGVGKEKQQLVVSEFQPGDDDPTMCCSPMESRSVLRCSRAGRRPSINQMSREAVDFCGVSEVRTYRTYQAHLLFASLPMFA